MDYYSIFRNDVSEESSGETEVLASWDNVLGRTGMCDNAESDAHIKGFEEFNIWEISNSLDLTENGRYWRKVIDKESNVVSFWDQAVKFRECAAGDMSEPVDLIGKLAKYLHNGFDIDGGGSK